MSLSDLDKFLDDIRKEEERTRREFYLDTELRDRTLLKARREFLKKKEMEVTLKAIKEKDEVMDLQYNFYLITVEDWKTNGFLSPKGDQFKYLLYTVDLSYKNISINDNFFHDLDVFIEALFRELATRHLIKEINIKQIHYDNAFIELKKYYELNFPIQDFKGKDCFGIIFNLNFDKQERETLKSRKIVVNFGDVLALSYMGFYEGMTIEEWADELDRNKFNPEVII